MKANFNGALLGQTVSDLLCADALRASLSDEASSALQHTDPVKMEFSERKRRRKSQSFKLVHEQEQGRGYGRLRVCLCVCERLAL